MRIFVLDDSSGRHAKFKQNLIGATVTQAWTADEAYHSLRHEPHDVVFLDHDLEGSGPRCGSGTEVVTAIVVLMRMGMYKSEKAIHCIHSLNFEKAKEMFDDLRKAGLEAKRCTQAWSEDLALNELVATGEWTLPERWTDALVFDDPV